MALKLYAGGEQDAWDIVQRLAIGDRQTLVDAVNRDVSDLRAAAQEKRSRLAAPTSDA